MDGKLITDPKQKAEVLNDQFVRLHQRARYKQPVTTYAYPGGYHTEDMLPIAHEFGYQFLFTVLPGKIRRDLDFQRSFILWLGEDLGDTLRHHHRASAVFGS